MSLVQFVSASPFPPCVPCFSAVGTSTGTSNLLDQLIVALCEKDQDL